MRTPTHTLTWRVSLLAGLALALVMPVSAQNMAAGTNMVVVMNAKAPINSLSTKDVADLYLGRSRNLSNGQLVMPLDNPAASPIRARFYKALTGKAITDINAYWARLLFTGQSSPPQAMPDANAILELVRSTPGAIGYLEQSQVPNPEAAGVKVVLSVNAP